MDPIEMVITGGTPDHLNWNTVLRSYAAEGFEEVLGSKAVANVPLEMADERVLREHPRLVLVFGSCFVDSCNYSRLRDACDRIGCPLAFWLHDDPYEFDAAARVVRLADHIFSNDRWAAEHYHRDRVWHLPLAASPTAHRRSHNDEMTRDVFFCGIAYKSRRRIIQDLAHVLRSVRTEIFGDGWDSKALPFCINRRVDNAGLADRYAASRVVLNLGRDFHLSNQKYQLDPSTPGPRTFEAAMAGSCQMMFADSLEILDYFKLDEEIVLFDNPKEFEELLTDLLEHPNKRAAIGMAAQARCLKDHTYACRARAMLRCIGLELPQAASGAEMVKKAA